MGGWSTIDRALSCLAPAGAASRPVMAWRPEAVAAGLPGLGGAQAGWLRDAGFTGAAGQVVLLPGEGPDGDRVVGAALGLGEERTPYSHAGLPAALPGGTVWRIEPGDFAMGDAVLGWCLGSYQFSLASKPPAALALLAGAEEEHAALAMARAAWLSRDLINLPANLLGPTELAEAVLALAGRFGAAGSVVEGAALAREYPMIAAVGAGSDRAPVVARFEWSGSGTAADAPLVSLCGKGVCFDTGGYDLKPSGGMLRMKKDMGGAALMLGLASVVMAMDLPIRLHVWVGCLENMVSGRAMRPLDVLPTRRGLSVEIGNTDAEGRLLLCDLLAEASDEGPELLVDAATLTGAARVALGPDLPALFCSDDGLAGLVMAAGVETSDPVWRLPLFDGYDRWLSSPVADINNVAGKPMAGAIVAALFLQRFIPKSIRWVHLDTYAWNDQSRPGRPEGGEALGLRALFATVERLSRFNSEDYGHVLKQLR